MNKHHIDYCRERVATVVRRQTEVLRKKYRIQEEKRLTKEEKLAWLRAKIDLPIKDSYYAAQAFDFSALEQEERFDEEKLNAALAALRKEADAICDRLVLGSSAEALALLENFERDDNNN